MAGLSLRARRSGQEPSRNEAGRYVLDTECEWLLEGPVLELDRVVETYPKFAERIAATVVLLVFRRAVGRYSMPGLGEIELVSGKWSEADFGGLLRDLTEEAAALPFARQAGSGLPYERALLRERRLAYHEFLFLRYALSAHAPTQDRLDLAVRRVIETPHRRQIGRDRYVPIEEARRVGTRGMLRALASPGEWHRTSSSDASAVAAAFGGYLPERFEEERHHASLDTPENRFVLAVLELGVTLVQRTREAVERWSNSGVREQVLAECERMARILSPLRAHAIWREVGVLAVFPASSMVLQRRHGYREVLRHFVRLRLTSRIPLDKQTAEDLLALKDIAALYELWAFFAVVRAVRLTLGQPLRAERLVEREGELIARRCLQVLWPDGTEALYNARFALDSARRSTSLPLRPDVALRIAEGPNRGLHLFDAKFKREVLPQNKSTEEDDEPFDNDANFGSDATFKHEDLYKMHAYRDAIADAQSVWILYPGTQFQFFPASDDAPAGVRHGVGAIPTRPGDSHLDEIVAELLRPRRPAH